MNKLQSFVFPLLVAIGLQRPASAASGEWEIAELRVEAALNPINIDQPAPRVTWLLSSSSRNMRQVAYRMLLNAGGRPLWDSGKVPSSETTNIRLSKMLASNSDYRLSVTSWNEQGGEATSETSFSTALLKPADWKAEWIGFRLGTPADPGKMTPEEKEKFPEPEFGGKSQYLRKEFALKGPVARARVFGTGVGLYELHLNGEKVGDHVLSPAPTRYDSRVLYEAFDVKSLLKIGPNAIGMHLGDGWFSGTKGFLDWRMKWSGYPRAIVQLHLQYADGSEETLMSGKDWRASLGPITRNGIYPGETYDARLEQKGWSEPGFDDSAWQNALTMGPPTATLQAQSLPPERVVQTIVPVATHTLSNGRRVFDMGQNFSGWCRIRVKGSPGAKVTLRHAEDQKDDKTLNASSNRKADATDIYILKGEAEETYEPRFTYHGFQYVEVSVEGEAEVTSVEGRVVHTDCPQTGTLETDNELINRIHHCTVWSQKSNNHGLPLDCPQRDERLGWVADGYVTADEMMCNFDASSFYEKWLDDMRLAQSEDGALPHVAPRQGTDSHALWSGGYLVLALEMFRTYGDKELLAQHFEPMCRYVDFLTEKSTGFILPMSRYGDWASPAQAKKGSSGWKRGTPEGADTVMFHFLASLAADAAKILNKQAEFKKYSDLKRKIAEAFAARYFDPATNTFRGEEYHFQFMQGLPLYLGMVETEKAPLVTEQLVSNITKENGHLVAGIIGTRYIVELLHRIGRDDLVFGMVMAKGFPSWESLTKGRTTLSEHWDQSGSHNHVMFGSIDAWFYRALAGIQIVPEAPGYREVLIKPYFPKSGLNRVHASIQTIRGKVLSSWQRAHGKINLAVEIPVNTQARIELPISDATQLQLDGKAVDNAALVEKGTGGNISIKLGSGRYQFAFPAASSGEFGSSTFQ